MNPNYSNNSIMSSNQSNSQNKGRHAPKLSKKQQMYNFMKGILSKTKIEGTD